MFSKIRKIIPDLVLKAKGKKKFKSCVWLEHGIIFDHGGLVRNCCEQSHEGKGRFIIDDSFNGIWLDIDKINSNKQILRNQVRNGIIPDSCKGCQFLVDDYWDDEVYFSNVLLTHWTDCNTRCVYCPAVRDNKLSSETVFNIIPIINQMYNNNIIDKETYFSIAGGESTIYPEFDKLIYHLMDMGIHKININTSAIRFRPSIVDAISHSCAEVVVSIDAAYDKLYKKIKGTDTFDVVIKNLKKYIEAQIIGEQRVILKMILLNGFNDNKREVLDWFMLCLSLGVRKLALDVDIAWYNKIKDNIPKYLTDIILFAKKMADINNVDLVLYDRADIIYKTSKID